MSSKDTFLVTLDRYVAAVQADPTGDEVITLRNMLLAQAGFSQKAMRGAANAVVDEHLLADRSGPL